MTSALTVPMIAAGSAAVKMSLDFDTAMTKIITLVGVGEEQVNEWRTELLKLGPALGKTPTELANALFLVTSASFRGAEAIDVLTLAAQGSAIGLGETTVVADAVTSAINAYGKANLSAADATAILRGAVQLGKAEADSIAPVLGNVVGVAAEMDVAFHEVAAAIASMTLAGTPAEVTVTNLSAILSTIQKGSIKTRKGLKGVGTSLDEIRATLKEKGLIGLLVQLKEKFEGNEDAAAQVFGNVRALRGLFGIVGKSAEQNIEIFRQLAEVTGEDLGPAVDYVASRPGHKLNQIFAQLQTSAITLGNAILPILVPAVQKLGEWIEKATTAFSNLDPRVQKFILAIAGIAAVAGPVLVAIGLIASGIAAISASWIVWTAKIAVGAVIVTKNWEAIKTGLAKLRDFFRPAFEEMKSLVLEAWTVIKDFAVRTWPIIREMIEKVVARINQLWQDHGETILRYVRRGWLVAKHLIIGSLEAVLGVVEFFLNVLNSDWPAAWKGLEKATLKVVDTIGRVLGAALLRMSAGWYDFAAAAGQAIARILGKIRGLVVAWMEIPFNKINPAAQAAGNAALDAIDVAIGGIAIKATEAKLAAQGLNTQADKLLEPLKKAKEGAAGVKDEIVKTGEAAKTAINESVISITRGGEEIKDSLKGGFGKGVEEGTEEAKTHYNNLQQWIKDNPLRPEIDTEWMQRQLEEAGLQPWTAGTLP
jgi:TP901 family phage tail tape measure protein